MSTPSISDPAALEREIAASARKDPRAAARRARSLRARARDPRARAVLLRAEGSALHAGGRHREALAAYRRARASFAGRGDGLERARVDLGASDALLHLGRIREALRTAEAARRAFLAAGKPVAAAMADANAAGVDWRLDRPAAARDRYLRARAAFEAAGHAFGAAACDLNLGNCLASLDEREEASAAYGRAREAFGRLDMGALVAEADYNEAWLRGLEDRPGEALALLDRAGAAFRAVGDARHGALVALDRGEVRLRCGLLPEAAEDLAAAAAGFAALGLGADRARALSLLGCARALSGDAAGARAPLDAAARLFARLGNRAGCASVDLYRALAAASRGGDPSAPATRAARVFRRLGMRTRAAQALLVRAGFRDDPADARAALALLRGLRAPGLAFAARRVLARSAAAAGRRAEAAREMEAALAAAEGLREGLTADEMRLAFVRDREAFFSECALFLLEGGGPDAARRALEVTERARSRALLDLALLGQGGAPAAEGREVGRLREALRFAYNRISGAAGDRLRGPVEAAGVRRLEVRLERALRVSRGGSGAAPAPRTADVLAHLPPDTAAAVYLLEEEEGRVLLARAGSVGEIRGLPGLRAAAAAAARLRHEMERAFLGGGFAERHARRLREDAEEALRDVRRAFLDPVLAAAPERRLVIVPRGPLHGLPFPALAPERVVSLAPSLAFLAPRPSGGGAPLLLGLPDGPGGAAGEEVRGLAARLPGARVLEGEAATRAAFLEGAPGASLLHLATHGVFRDDNPMASALRLADGWIAAHEVLAVRLQSRLVVLSACESGSARVAPGDEILGLVRGFLGAGARAVAASLWRVPDLPTARLMNRLYDGLVAGLPVDEALAGAQAVSRSAGEHPAAWAAFVTLGPAVGLDGPAAEPRPLTGGQPGDRA